ncbi:hypothetical protein E2C01_042504 [Portunus trituberculatus]|uniref:Uncharacterized protein n=1 Tax=Portunus trituberculatus TaxID=210409 RepID=A0A5B7FQF0_PORTR|nr:hypothetical protein [Portunus trituberculatus]
MIGCDLSPPPRPYSPYTPTRETCKKRTRSRLWKRLAYSSIVQRDGAQWKTEYAVLCEGD